MNNGDFGIIVSPMERGQITLPKPYREKLGILPGMPLQVLLRAEEIIVRPLATAIGKYVKTIVTNPQIEKKDYLAALVKVKGVYWNKDDDKLLKKKERILQW